MTAPLIDIYSKHGIETNISFSVFCAQNMQYSIEFPNNWSVNNNLGDYVNAEVSFCPPSSEGGVHELTIVTVVVFLSRTRLSMTFRILTTRQSPF